MIALNTSKQSAGFSLIELLITVALIAFLVLAALPLTGAWVDGQERARAKGELIEAVAKAKAMAMRNPEGIYGSNGLVPVAALCFTNNVLSFYLRQDKNLVFSPCTGLLANAKKVWATTMNSKMSILDDDSNNPFQGACFDSRGNLLRSSPFDPGSCDNTLYSKTLSGIQLKSQQGEADNVNVF